MRLIVSVLLVIVLGGCSSSSSSTKGGGKATTSNVAGEPQIILELTDQTTVFECPFCHMIFDGPGKCSMACADLVAMNVTYICPADNKPVGRAGKCERCDMEARVEKTVAVAVTPVPPVVSGN